MPFSSPLSPPVPSAGPTNVSALATTSSSMLVRWSPVPEAERNGLVLGYKVSLCRLPHPGCPAPPGAQSLPPERARGICLASHPLVALATRVLPWGRKGVGFQERHGVLRAALPPPGSHTGCPKPHAPLRWAQCQFLSPSRILPQSQAPAWTSGDVPAGPGSAAAGCVTLRKSHALSGPVCSLRKLPAPWLSASLGPRFPVPRGALRLSHCKEPRSTCPVHPSAPGQGT